MAYSKLISYGDNVELYLYENDCIGFGRKKVSVNDSSSDLETPGDSHVLKPKPRIQANARRAGMAFRRIISANLGFSDVPILATFTYAENFTEIGRARKDWNSFVRNLRSEFGEQVRYIVVPEFQKRGAIHFHALLWGLPSQSIVGRERETRKIARYWGKGFVDLKLTDGSEKLAGYLSKYMEKGFLDSRLDGKKLYLTSRNIIRPIVVKNPILGPYFHGGLDGIPDLSTAEVVLQKDYMTQWLGKGRFKLYKLKSLKSYDN